jgi:plasmid stabilization system protein ParE
MGEPYRLILSPQASADLIRLHSYISRDSADNAAKTVERILNAVEGLRTVPHRTVMERQSRKIRHPVRTLPVGAYVVYFRSLDDERVVRVLTIRHGARRRPRRFD